MLQHADLFGPFDEVRPYVQRGLEIVGAVGCELEAARGQRLLLWIHLFDPHAPYDPLPEDRIFGDRPIDLYDAEIRAMDRAFGALLELIDAQLGRERCVVAVTSDHGEAFGEHGVWYHKSGLHEEQVRVPLLVRAPGLRPHRVQRPVSHVDLLPTVFELAGWPLPANDGLSLLEVHAGGERPVFCRHEDCALAVRRGRWKLMADFGTGARRLFDLRSDPREREDVAHRHADVVQDLDDLLLAFDGGRGGHLGRTFGETAVLSMAGTLASTGQGPVRAFARHVLSLRR
jgi:arylsulfatase A-like enzyme